MAEKGLLDYIDKEDALKIGGGVAGIYGAAHGFKYTPMARGMLRKAGRTSTEIKGFYDQGAKKIALGWDHYLHNWQNTLDKIIKKFPEEFKAGMSKLAKEKQILEVMRLKGDRTPAELLASMNLERAQNIASVKGRDFVPSGSSLKRMVRHEKLKNVMIRVAQGEAISPREMIPHGLSGNITTDMKTLFKGHGGAIRAWNINPDQHISASEILHTGGDRRTVISAAKRDPMFKIAEAITKSNANINNLDEVKAIAKRVTHALTSSELAARQLHPHLQKDLPGAQKELYKQFMDSYRINRGGNLAVNYSPKYKPHILSGGMNADAEFWSGPKKMYRGVLKKAPFHYDLIVSDNYDVFKGSEFIQRKTHMNFVHDTTEKLKGGSKKAIRHVPEVSRITQRSKLKKSITEKNVKSTLKAVGRIGYKGAKLIARRALFRI